MSSQTPNLWAVDLQTVALVQGQATYSVPANTVAILDAYFTIGAGSAATNRYMLPISRSEYAAYPVPQQQGAPSVYWFDRLLSPTVTIYPVPDGTQVSFSYWRARMIQDVTLNGAQSLDMPVYYLEPFALGLARRLAMVWAPDKYQMLKAEETEAFAIAADQGVETAAFYVSPMIGGYFRN
jgi:hypothetical protein